MKILKFGGSSVAQAKRIQRVGSILKSYYARGEKFAVVFSAFGGITDQLIEMSTLAAKGDADYLSIFEHFSDRHQSTIIELIQGDAQSVTLKEIEQNHQELKNLLQGIFLLGEASPRTMDYVLSFGERNAAFIISQFLKSKGIDAHYLDARRIIKTNTNFGAAQVDLEKTYAHIKNYFHSHAGIHIITGFISSTSDGLTTTLGRGGSDYTASLLAAGLAAEKIEIWTDVDGVLTADPRKVKSAFTIPQMSYAEAMEMSHFGAKVIYPPTLQPALAHHIPLAIRNTFNPDFLGTLISATPSKNAQVVKGISSITQIALLTLEGSGLFGVPGTAARLFNALAQGNINIILITQGSSEHAISFAIQPKEANHAKHLVEKAFEYEIAKRIVSPVKVEKELSVIAVIGENMRYQPGISGRLFKALGKNGINCVAIAQGSSELNVSIVIPSEDETKALNVLHESFFLSDTQVLHVFMIGVGLIGSTLLEQIKKQASFLKNKRFLSIQIIALANSRKMLFEPNGISLETWKENLEEADEPMKIENFIQQMFSLNLANSVFVDNTANESVTQYYDKILDESISISTPNKIATSSAFLQYQRLKGIAKKRGVQFLYETNVGAGLPVLTTLRDLINSGDQILKIEGVLSGSLSFIFNHYEEDVSFKEIVKKASALGYTEPDPRIDLKGIDVRRKLLILAREIGLALESEDVHIEPILPPSCIEAADVESFFEQLEQEQAFFENRRMEAHSQNKKLRMIAKLENGMAEIGLQSVSRDNPFYNLSGSDNMIVFTTERYKARPLVITGPGAGAEVTAAGVFAEIISIANIINE